MANLGICVSYVTCKEPGMRGSDCKRMGCWVIWLALGPAVDVYGCFGIFVIACMNQHLGTSRSVQ